MTDTVPGLGPCGVRWLDRLLVVGGSKRLWSYFFAHPSQESIVPGTGPGGVFVPHASEIVYVFGGVASQTPHELALAGIMTTYWTSFATYGDPNVGMAQGLRWPNLRGVDDRVLRLDTSGGVTQGAGLSVQAGLRHDACVVQAQLARELGKCCIPPPLPCCSRCSLECVERDCTQDELERTAACNCGGEYRPHNHSQSGACHEMCGMASFCRECDRTC